MKTILPLLAFLALFTLALRAGEPAAANPEALEAAFKATMTSATMSGRWCSVKDGVLGDEKDDKYIIVGVEKVSGSSWIIKASMRGVVLPLPIQVKWASDAAIMIVEKLQLPGANGYGGGSTYSARVMIHEHTYAGTWSGGDHGGLMKGVITNGAASPK